MCLKFWNNGRISGNVPRLTFDNRCESHRSTFVLKPSMVKEFMTESYSKQGGVLQKYSFHSSTKPSASNSFSSAFSLLLFVLFRHAYAISSCSPCHFQV